MLIIPLLSFVALALCSPTYPKVDLKPKFDGVLRPAIHWQHDFGDYLHLLPSVKNRLYFSEFAGLQSSYRTHRFSDIEFDFWTPTVFLEKSKYLNHIECAHNVMTIQVDGKTAFNMVKKEWSSPDGLMIATVNKKCTDSRFKDQHTFWNVSSATFTQTNSGGIVQLTGELHGLQHRWKSMSWKWGRYNPPKIPRSPGSPDKRWDIPINASITISSSTADFIPPQDESPWGLAYKLYESAYGDTSLAAYCVDCGLTETMTLFGAVNIDIGLDFWNAKITTAQVGISGQMHLGLGLGLVAEYAIDETWEHDIGEYAIDGLSVAGVGAVGVTVSVGVQGDFNFKVGGQVLGQAALDWPSVYALADLLDASNSQLSGFEPQPSSSFTASSGVSVEATASIPVELGLQLKIDEIGFDEEIGLRDSPGVQLTAEYSTDGGENCGTTPGIDWHVDLVNSVELDVLGYTIPLDEWDSGPIFGGCLS